jgi:hypothetical protein
MIRTVAKMAVAGVLALGALTLASDGAFAMPTMDSGVSVAAKASQQVDEARWVCGPYRCWRHHGYYGWHRWHRWHHWHHWHRWHHWHHWHHWRRW